MPILTYFEVWSGCITAPPLHEIAAPPSCMKPEDRVWLRPWITHEHKVESGYNVSRPHGPKKDKSDDNLIVCQIVICKFGIFVRILFLQITLKDIFATFKIRDLGMIYLNQ